MIIDYISELLLALLGEQSAFLKLNVVGTEWHYNEVGSLS